MSSVLKTIKQKLLLIIMLGVTTGVMVFSVPPAQAQAPCVQRVFGWGSNDTCVGYIQTMLDEEGTVLHWANWSWIGQDNAFGPITKGQVKAFQSYTNNWPDGIVGPSTWGSLCYKASYVYYYTPPTKGSLYLYDTANAAGCHI